METKTILSKTFEDLTTETSRRTGELNAAEKELKSLTCKHQLATKAVSLHAEECNVLRVVGELLQQKIKERVEKLVTMVLRGIFGPDYRFFLDIDHKRGQAVATPMIEFPFKGEMICAEVRDAKGGGIVNVTAFVLQVVVLSLSRPRLAKVMILDEVFKNVSREYLPKVAELLGTLSRITKIQFVLVTHKGEFAEAADKVFEVSKNEAGVTKIKERE